MIEPNTNPPPEYWQRIESGMAENQSILDLVEEIKKLSDEILEDLDTPSYKDEQLEVLEEIEDKLNLARSRLI